MDNFGVSARVAEFDKRNGGNPAQNGEWYWYANGAVREFDPLGPLIDPPADEYARLTNIVTYHQARLAKAVREFDDFKEQIFFSADCNKEALSHLKQLQAVVGERNAAVEAAKKKLAATEEGQRRERSRQMDAEQQQKQTQFREEVKAVRI